MSAASTIGLLYHYTSEGGLRGILESDRMWATDIRFLNDYTEFRQAFKEAHVETLTDAFLEGLPDIDNTARMVIEGVLSKRNHAEILQIIENSTLTNKAFVCSFTTLPQSLGADAGDRLSQWRGYSHSSQGFSLGFDKALLEKQIELNNPGAKAGILECIYEDHDKRSFFREMGRNASARFNERWRRREPVPEFRTNHPSPSEEYKKSQFYFLKSLSEVTAEVFTKAARIKDSGFREECEWRIVLQASRDALQRPGLLRFRKGQFGETPFVEIPLGLRMLETSPLRRIVVGLGNQKEDAKHWVELFLETHGILVKRDDTGPGVEVVTSVIPYRSA
jgi:hypothetical protein